MSVLHKEVNSAQIFISNELLKIYLLKNMYSNNKNRNLAWVSGSHKDLWTPHNWAHKDRNGVWEVTWLLSFQAGSESVALCFCVWLLPWLWCSSPLLLSLPSLTNNFSLFSFSLPRCFSLLAVSTSHFLRMNYSYFLMSSAYCLLSPCVNFGFCPLAIHPSLCMSWIQIPRIHIQV